MAHPRKKRRANNRPQPASATTKAQGGRSPKSMVIRTGASEVGPHISQLVRDVRLMMEPDTAGRLKERRGNRLRDYTTMAGPLGVTHLLLFSKSKESGNTNLRLALTPRGPTVHFRVEKYSLCQDIAKRTKSSGGSGGKGGKIHARAPLLVMNNFTTPTADADSTVPSSGKGKGKEQESKKNEIPKQLESLTTTVFQSLFPPISPQTTPLDSIRRIMLLNRETKSEKGEDIGTYTINLRHYAITTKRLGPSKRVRRLDPRESKKLKKSAAKKGLPNLGKLDDVADYLLDPAAGGYTSASESEIETDAEVEVLETETRKVLNRKEMQRIRSGEGKLPSSERHVEKRAVKLVELGPRMKLRMIKIEEEVCGGKVMWHEFVNKTNTEVHALDQMWEKRGQEKEKRRNEQRENVERKRKEKGTAGKTGEGEGDDDEPEDDEDWYSDAFDEDDEVVDPDGDDDEDMDGAE